MPQQNNGILQDFKCFKIFTGILTNPYKEPCKAQQY